MPKLIPLTDRVLVRIKKGPTEKRGIIIPESSQEKPQQAVVIAVGPGIYEDGKYYPLDLKEGDVVLFQKHAGQDFILEEGAEPVTILEYVDILAKVGE